ncbi:MAG: proton-conducting transporter membrane subunit [Burkholderiaceae bacterium]
MTFTFVPPFVVFLLGALVASALPARFISWTVISCALVAGILAFITPEGVYASIGFFKYSLELAVGGNIERISQVALCAAVTLIGIAATKQAPCRYHAWGLVLAGLASGVLASGDLISFFLFFELIVITTTVLIAAGRTPESATAALQFIIIQLLASIVFKVGMSDFHHRFDSYSLSAVNQPILESPLSWVLIIGLLVKVSAWPLAFLTPTAISKSVRTGQPYLAALLPLAAISSIWKIFSEHTDHLVFLVAGGLMILYGLIYGAQRRGAPVNQTAYGIAVLSGLALGLGATSNGIIQSYTLSMLPIISVLILLSAQKVQAQSAQVNATQSIASTSIPRLKDTDTVVNLILLSALSPLATYLLHFWSVAYHKLHKFIELAIKKLEKLTGSKSPLGGHWGIGLTCLWVIVLLGLYGTTYLLF